MSDTIKQTVRQKYGQAALRVLAGSGSSCCGASAAGESCDPVTSNIYSPGETAGLPETAVLASLGCGNPTALAELKPGDVVLDLGSGGGIDCFLAANKVGPSGKVIGVDMTPEMIEKARFNAKKGGYKNVEFRLAEIEALARETPVAV